MTLDCEVVLTREGAKAVRDRLTGELMHPVVGPLVESERLYVVPSRLEARLRIPTEAPLVLFDVGLGAGSNAITAWRVSESLPAEARRLEIVSFDRSSAALALALDDAHAAAFGFVEGAGTAARSVLETGHAETARTRWTYVEGDALASLAAVTRFADIVFWDPFSPGKNPALWSVQAFRQLFARCNPGATVHTYSGATSVRSALLLGGFAVGTGQIIGDGRSGTEAALAVTDLAHPLDARWLARLGRSSAPFPVDAPPDAVTLIAAMPQFAAPAV